MPSGPRIRTNNVFGTVTDNPLLVGATTMNSAGLTNLDAVSSAHALIILDPLRSAGAPEMVIVTAHTAAATSATITRGAYGTTARQHASGVLWVHAASIEDAIQILTSSTRPSDPYRGQLIFETDTNSFVARDTSDAWQTAVPLGAWVSYTPTLTQSGAVTKTVTYAKYNRVGRMINLNVLLACTGAGTANNAVAVGLPVAAATSTGTVMGAGVIFDQSANANYGGVAYIASSTTIQMVPSSANVAVVQGQTGASFAAALANLDTVTFSGAYEAAS